MNTEETFKEKTQRKLNAWKASLEHLNVQLHLGAEEAKDEFEKQKKNLAHWIDITGEKLHETKDISKEKALQLKTAMEELRVQAALGRAETEDALKEQQENLKKGIHNLKYNIAEVYKTTKEEIDDFADKAHDKLDDFHTRFDLFKLHAHLAKMDAGETWAKKKKELSVKLHNLNTKLEESKDTSSDKWDHFSKEIAAAWHHFRIAFKS